MCELVASDTCEAIAAMNRKLSLVILLTSLSAPSAPAWSLGVGEARVASALGAPLEAVIPLTDTQGVSPQALAVSLADAEGYRRAGLQRSLLLDSLTLTVVPRPEGLVVLVRSQRAMRDPYLDLLVELDGPDGRQRRQVTLLFDPPGYGSQVAMVATPRTGSLPRPGAEREVATPSPAPSAQASSASARAAAGREAGYVDVGDTLWRVAERLRPPSGITMPQMMMALLDANPDAFSGGNINRLRAGYVLDAPPAAQILTRSAQEASRQVKAHHRAFSRGEPLPDMASAASPAVSAGSAADPGAPATGPAASGDGADTAESNASDRPSDNGQVEGALAASSREGDDERDGPASADKAGAVEASPTLAGARPEDGSDTPRLTLLTDAQVESEANAEAAASVSGEQAARLDRLEARLKQSQQSLASVRAERDQTRAALAALREEVAGLQDSLSTLSASQSSSMAQAGAGAEGAGGSLVDRYLMPLWATIGQMGRTLSGQLAGAGLVLLLSLWWLVRRRRAADRRDHIPAAEEPSGRVASPTGTVAGQAGAGDDEFEPVAGDDDAPGRFAQESTEAVMPRAEAVSEADIFIAYGRYDQARVLLEEGLEAEPERHDLRLKLIKVLVEQGQWQKVHAEAERLDADADPARQAELMRLLAREWSAPTDSGETAETENGAEERGAMPAAAVDDDAEASPSVAMAPLEPTPAFRPPIEREPVAFDGKGGHARPSWQRGTEVSPEDVSAALRDQDDADAEQGASSEAAPTDDATQAEEGYEKEGLTKEGRAAERRGIEGGAGQEARASEDERPGDEEVASDDSAPPEPKRANVIDYTPPPLELEATMPDETPMQPSVDFVQAEDAPAIGEDAASDLADMMRDTDRDAAAHSADDDGAGWDIEEVAFEPLHLDNGQPVESPPVTRALVGEAETRLEQGDHVQARDLLDRALEEGDGEIREQARRMIAQYNL
ncbi:FimV/HubP family polar landmark protein [Onishia taeanensis]